MRLYDKNMIEMRDGRKPVISPQPKSVSNYIDISLDDIREACEAAFKNHSKKNDVVNFNSDFDGNSLKLYEWYLDGTYVSKIKYRKLIKENKNGKVREINSPDLTTRIYQHLVLVKLGPLYYEYEMNATIFLYSATQFVKDYYIQFLTILVIRKLWSSLKFIRMFFIFFLCSNP